MMSEEEISVLLPLDEDGFFRRECPLCMREFKIYLQKEELTEVAEQGIDTFMAVEDEINTSEDGGISSESDFTCPYCGQQAKKEDWWTNKQLEYMQLIAHNYIAGIINKDLIRPLKRSLSSKQSGLLSITFEAKEMKQMNEWIPSEINDMEIVKLPCCQRKMKVDSPQKNVIYCFFCGFPHGQE
jgi:hypothetical protein